jgi:hypothetical protein
MRHGWLYWEAGTEEGGLVAWVLLALDVADGMAVPAAGAGGVAMLAGAAAGAGAAAAAAPLRCGGLGMVSGPVWPQADNNIEVARAVASANEDFTIRIRV